MMKKMLYQAKHKRNNGRGLNTSIMNRGRNGGSLSNAMMHHHSDHDLNHNDIHSDLDYDEDMYGDYDMHNDDYDYDDYDDMHGDSLHHHGGVRGSLGGHLGSAGRIRNGARLAAGGLRRRGGCEGQLLNNLSRMGGRHARGGLGLGSASGLGAGLGRRGAGMGRRGCGRGLDAGLDGGLDAGLGRGLGSSGLGLGTGGHRRGYGGLGASSHRGGCGSRGTGRTANLARMMDRAKINSHNRAGCNHSRLRDGTTGYRSTQLNKILLKY